MKGRQIALDHIAGQEAAALLDDGRLQDILIAPKDTPAPGTIYRAICDQPFKGQGGIMLKTPDGPAFFRQAKGLSPGQPMFVQVTGYAEPGKAIPVTAKLLFKSRYAIVTPDAPGLNVSRRIRDEDTRDGLMAIAHDEMEGQPMGLILRSSCEEADEDAIAEDIAAMRDLALRVTNQPLEGNPEVLHHGDGPHLIAWREWVEPAQVETAEGSFETTGVLDALEALRSPQQALSGGGSIFVEPTRALVAVDVNTGGDTSPAACLKANLAACRALPRRLRLMGFGGQIVLDFAPLSKKDRRQVEQTLRAAFRDDPIDTALVGWTPLGHFELQRKRERMALDFALLDQA